MSNDRATCWSITINNPNSSDEECISMARQKGWKVEGQRERGEEGTEHYQLAVRTPQVRFSAVKKAFPRAHIEIARNPTALKQYVHKDETKVADLSLNDEMYPSQAKIWQWFGEYCNFYVDDCDMKLTPFDWSEDHLLLHFDRMICEKIKQGYYCEMIGVNPQVRAAVKRYGHAIYCREAPKARKTYEMDASSNSLDTVSQTDRQTQQIILPMESINAVPTEEDALSEPEEEDYSDWFESPENYGDEDRSEDSEEGSEELSGDEVCE